MSPFCLKVRHEDKTLFLTLIPNPTGVISFHLFYFISIFLRAFFTSVLQEVDKVRTSKNLKQKNMAVNQ